MPASHPQNGWGSNQPKYLETYEGTQVQDGY